MCQMTAGCEWWTFNSMTSYCILAGDCSILDPSCTTCLAGERLCETNVQPPVETDLTKLFILGGYDGSNRHADAEILDMPMDNTTASDVCVQPDNFDYDIEEAVGFNVEGAPMICGG